MEQFNAENHLEYSFNFIIHKSLQAAAAQNYVVRTMYLCGILMFQEVSLTNHAPIPRLLTIVLSHLSFIMGT